MPNGDGGGPYDAELHEARVTAKVFARLCQHMEEHDQMLTPLVTDEALEWWLKYKRMAKAVKQRQRKHKAAEADRLKKESARMLREAEKLEAGEDEG